MTINLPFALTMGDPAGIGGECTIKAWRARREMGLPPFFVHDDPAHLKSIDPDIPLVEIAAPKEAIDIFDKALPVLPLTLAERPVKGVLNTANGGMVIGSIKKAVRMALDGEVAGVVTNPIHKAALYECGFAFPGHTEFLQELCGGKTRSVMMLATKELRVVPLTIHMPLKDVPTALNQTDFESTARILYNALLQDFGIERPHIAVAGLNPHAGENGTIGVEEKNFIEGWIATLRKEGVHITGPYPSDAMFHEAARNTYDAAFCMYHDQALIPLKTLDFFGGVNMTLGLPIIRTSPDHGTALDIAGTGQVNPKSLINAILTARDIAAMRKRY